MFRKCLFILPNLFTLSSVFCGLAALVIAASASRPVDYLQAALAVVFAVIFDGCDGRVARMTRTQSEFGLHLDSLADVISFGVAPAFLIYQWALRSLPAPWGLLIAFVFVAAGACRLARFNVLATRAKGRASDFVGLPIPLAAGMLVTVVIAQSQAGIASGEALQQPVIGLTLLLSGLMVSSIRYRSFKTLHLSRSVVFAVLGLVVLTVAFSLRFRASLALMTLFGLYVATGPIAAIAKLGARVVHRHSLIHHPAGDPDAPQRPSKPRE